MKRKRKPTGAPKGRKQYKAERKAQGLTVIHVNMPHSMAKMFADVAAVKHITVSHAVVLFILESLESK
jgi:hypothetical protein